MAFNIPAAYGVYSNDVALPEVVQILNQSGFSKEDICMMVSPKHPLAGRHPLRLAECAEFPLAIADLKRR